MFSPVGKKKILLQIKRAKEAGIDDPLKVVMERMGGSPGKDSEKDSEAGSPERKKELRGAMITTAKIDKLLAEKGMDGVVMRKVMESTNRYDPTKDSITLRLFQNKCIATDLFRDILNKAFWLTFTDVEYRFFLDIFDPHDNGVIDGYQFMIAFVRLAAIRKDKIAEAARLKQAGFEKQQKEADELKKVELERKNDIAADFDFDPSTRDDAMRKLQIAAKKFDPARSPSLEAFNGKYMTAAVLREMLKRVFNLKVTSKELGAILLQFAENDAADARAASAESGTVPQSAEAAVAAATAAENAGQPTGPSQISCSDFLRQFLRLGIEARDRITKDQRAKQILANKQAEEEHRAKLEAQEAKLSMTIDYEFGEVDIARAEEKFTRCATGYDKNAPGCVALDGFECESLTPGPFSDLVRRTFGLKLSGKELGYLIRKFDKTGKGNINCKQFLSAFMKTGQQERDKARLRQLEKQRKLDELAIREKEEKARAVLESSSTFKISFDYTEQDMDNATEKLTEASIWFDKSRGGSLASFEQKALSPLEFHRALVRTFNVRLTPEELGAVIVSLDKASEGNPNATAKEGSMVNSKEFLNSFVALGFNARAKKQITQIKASKDAEKKMKEEAEAKRLALLEKTDIDIDYNVTPEERDAALEKMAEAALKYDKAHPAAKSLDGFSCKELSDVAFYGLVRRTFDLKLNAKECGALVTHFDISGTKHVNCQEFLTVFLQLGYTQRAKLHEAQLEKQRKENEARKKHEEEVMKKTLERGDTLKINMDYTERDAVSAQAKLLEAAEGYDKGHPSAPSLAAFEIAFMSPQIFRENMKRCFHVKLNPSELGYCVATYGSKKDMIVRSPEFLTAFIRQGKEARYKKQSEQLVKQRELIRQAKDEEEKKLKDQAEGAEFKVDLDDHTEADLESALKKMQSASKKFHEPTSTLKGFTGGPLKPGEFRGLVRRSFNLALSPQETAALINAFPFIPFGGEKPSKDKTGPKPNSIDSKQFLIKFMKLGHEARAQEKNEALENQRKAEAFAEKERLRKKRIQEQKITTDIDWDYGEMDKSSIYKKLTEASAKYDKNAPGCVSLSAFEALYLTPVVMKEVMKRTFNIIMSPKELAVLMSDFDNGDGNLHCQNFIVYFIKLGADERNKFKLIMLEKQARDNERRKTAHERKMREAEEKMNLSVSYNFSEDEKTSSLEKLRIAAKKYDKNTPGSMSLEGFDPKTLSAGVFREMIKRTFGLVLTQGELGALMCQFDKDKTGEVVSQDFLIYFLKVGTAERHKGHAASLVKQREAELAVKKAHEDAMAAQWAKLEISIDQPFASKDRDVALEKLQEAAFRNDPSLPVAFQVKFLKGSVFREMIKRTFGLRLTNEELAALVKEFEHPDEPGAVDCKAFMVEFNRLGIEARRNMTVGNVVKNRIAMRQAKEEHEKVLAAAEKKMENVVDMKYSKQDFNSALEKLRKIAGNYERGHPSSPSLAGFKGANMLPFVFKDMLMRTFGVPLTSKELGALTKFFDTSGSNTIDSAEFLAHFSKVNRQEMELKRKTYITKLRMLETAEKTKEAEFQSKVEKEEQEKMRYDKEDEVSFLKKIRDAAEQYAVDSASVQEPLQAFKGPALNAVAFIDIFRRIFHGIRFTHKEYGVLLSIMNAKGNGGGGVAGNTVDGPQFLNWFYKLGRQMTLIMLGESEDDLTLEKLRQGDVVNAANSGAGTTAKVDLNKKLGLKPFNKPTEKKAKAKKLTEESEGSFNNATIGSSWVLPAAVNDGLSSQEQDPITNDTISMLGGGVDGGGSLTGSVGSRTSTGAPRGGKKLALMLLSEDGYKVGGASYDGGSRMSGKPDALETSGMLVPSLPGGKMNHSKPEKKKKAKAEAQASDVVKEVNPHTGKPSIGTQAKRSKLTGSGVGLGSSTPEAAAPPAGFFFPTLLGSGSQSSITDKTQATGSRSAPVLMMPNVGFSGMNALEDVSNGFY